jgi:6-pyruvoyl-tetrahydropterin synthase
VAEFALRVREHMRIAHSLPDPAFGRAQGMHGATFVVDVTFFRGELNESNMALNIGLAHEALKAVLAPLNFGNLDEIPDLKGKLTTTEFLCRYIFDQLVDVISDGFLGEDGKAVSRIRVTLVENHVSRVWYESALPA